MAATGTGAPPEGAQAVGDRTEPEVLHLLDDADGSLLDIVDNLLDKGVVLTGEVILGLAGVDLVYLRLSAVLCAADRILAPATKAPQHAGDEDR